MPTSPADTLPLTGADCFLRAFDGETRRRSGASHLSQLVLRLGPGFDLRSFRNVLAQVVDANPILRAPIGRRFGVGAPAYRVGLATRCAAPRIEVHRRSGLAPLAPSPLSALATRGLAPLAPSPLSALATRGLAPLAPSPLSALATRGLGQGVGASTLPVPELFAARLNEVFAGRRGELLLVDVVCWEDATDLAFTWLHMLLDGAGSEHFVAFLEACRSGARAPDAVPAADRPGAAPEVTLPPSLRARGAMASSWQRRLHQLGALGVRSPAGPLLATRQRLVYQVEVHSPEQTAQIRKRASELAGFLTPMLFYLCVAIRAHHEVMRRRPEAPRGYVVPLPVNLRPKGGDGGIFRTRVSILWFGVSATLVDDFPALLQELKEQRRNAIRDGQIEAGVAAMDFARFAPARLYAHIARRALVGELCSFFFAYTDAFCSGLDSFFGAPVVNGFHAPSVPASPGSGLVFSLHAGRLHCTQVWQQGVFDGDELARLRAQLARDLLGPD